MSDLEARASSMLFDYGTTYRTDYRNGAIKEPVLTTYKKKERCMMKRPPQLRDIHTLSDWKATIPFGLLLKKKDIVGTNPMSVQQPYERTIDAGREEAQMTRPRLVMTPAVSMDDILDKRVRTILCEDMYTSTTSHGLQEAVSPYLSEKAPSPGLPTKSNPVSLPNLQLPVVSPEWRMETISWDTDQLRGQCDPTKEFWLSHALNPCRACEETAAMNAHRKMQRKTMASRR